MADAATISQIGQINLTGDDRALFLTKFGGQVLKRFEEMNIARGMHMVMNVPPGQKSLQFPATWKATSQYHTAGNELLAGNQIRMGQRLIHIDSKLLSFIWIDELDEMLSHFDARSIYASQIGEAVAETVDQQAFQVVCLAARAAAPFTGGDGGTQLTDPAFATSGAALGTGLFAAAQVFDEKRIPSNERNAVYKPEFYYDIVQTKDLINKDFGGEGSLAAGTINRVADIAIHKSNNIPSTDKSGDSTTGHLNTYVGDFSNTVGVAFHKSAIGTLTMQGLSVGTQWYETYQANILVAKTAQGTGILRAEAAIEFLKA